MKKKINDSAIYAISFFIWSLYFIYSIGTTIYDSFHLQHLKWNYVSNQTTVYSSRRSTTITYIFEKEGVRVSRKYPGLIEGANTWLWGIDKKKNREDISFYIRNKDYEKIRNNQIPYKHDFFGNRYSQKETIPFFGLRKINSDSNKILLALDIWKYNYNWLVFLVIIIIYLTLGYILKRIKFIEIIEDKSKKDKYLAYVFWFIFGITLINLLV